MSESNVIETERLALRHLTMDDLDALALIYRDPEVRKYFPEGTLTYEQTREELEWIIDVYYGQHGFGLVGDHVQADERVHRSLRAAAVDDRWALGGRSGLFAG